MRSCEYHKSASFYPGKDEACYTSLVPFAVFAWPEQQHFWPNLSFYKNFCGQLRKTKKCCQHLWVTSNIQYSTHSDVSLIPRYAARTSGPQVCSFEKTLAPFQGPLLQEESLSAFFGWQMLRIDLECLDLDLFWSIYKTFPNFWAVFTFQLFFKSVSSSRSICATKKLKNS